MRILFAEDDDDLRDMFTDKLRARFSCLVESVSSGNKAIGLLKSPSAYDIIVSDYIMDDGSGLDLLSFKIKSNITTPFIFFTSTIDPKVPFPSDEFLIIEKAQFKVLCKEIERVLKCETLYENNSNLKKLNTHK